MCAAPPISSLSATAAIVAPSSIGETYDFARRVNAAVIVNLAPAALGNWNVGTLELHVHPRQDREFCAPCGYQK
jgi:hypothetical protein